MFHRVLNHLNSIFFIYLFLHAKIRVLDLARAPSSAVLVLSSKYVIRLLQYREKRFATFRGLALADYGSYIQAP